jgi:uncharacterized protein YndB with AHSA1/START domain
MLAGAGIQGGTAVRVDFDPECEALTMNDVPRPAATEAEGDFGVVTGPDEVRFERLLPGPIERVWEYLVDSEKRALWLAGGEMELRPGGRLELNFFHANLSSHVEQIPERYKPFEHGTTNYGTVTECDPPRLLSFRWAEGDDDHSEVTFALTQRQDRVLLTLTHRRLRTRELMLDVAAGWHAHLGILADRLDGVEPRPFWSTHERMAEEYQRRLRSA